MKLLTFFARRPSASLDSQALFRKVIEFETEWPFLRMTDAVCFRASKACPTNLSLPSVRTPPKMREELPAQRVVPEPRLYGQLVLPPVRRFQESRVEGLTLTHGFLRGLGSEVGHRLFWQASRSMLGRLFWQPARRFRSERA